MNIKVIINNHKKSLLIGSAILLFLLIAIPTMSYVVIEKSSRNELSRSEATSDLPEDYQVAIVFGGGIRNSQPLPLLQDRLTTAKELLEAGKIKKIIVSGDNRYLSYNEPQAMLNYLVNQGVDEESIQLDNAGRSTYETCERASKIFGLKKAVLISESTHLPRAAFLCKNFGVETINVPSDGETAKKLKLSQTWREVLARTKAMLNIYIIGEDTVLGDPIHIKTD